MLLRGIALLIVAPAAFAGDAEKAVKETLMWLKERENFVHYSCRLAGEQDVRENRISEIGDVLLKGKKPRTVAPEELNMGHYVRIRLAETSSDTLGSRLARLGLSLQTIPKNSCAVWDKMASKRPGPE